MSAGAAATKGKGEKVEKAPSPFAILSPIDVTPEQREALGLGEDARVYVRRGDQTSKTSKGAIAQAVGANGAGTYIAVPARSFVERSAAPVGQPRIKWS